MKVALYARVSDDKLKEDGERRQDVKRQIEILNSFVKRMKWEFNPQTDLFIDDGKSAFREDYNSRPAFVKLLRAIKGHYYQRVLVEDMTRWSRRDADGMQTLRVAAEAGCTVTSLHEGEFDVTYTEGWAKAKMFLFLAEYQSRIMSDKVKSGMARILPCEFCKTVHTGRHPNSCQCELCKKRVGLKLRREREAEKKTELNLPQASLS